MRILNIFLLAGLVLAVLAPSVSFAQPVKIGTTMEGFSLPGLEGGDKNITFDKKVNIVSFWVSSCALCKEELKVLNAIAEEKKGKDLQITVVSTDFGGAKIVNFVLQSTNTENKLDILIDTSGAVARKQFGAVSYPYLFMLDKTGKVIWYMDGLHSDSEERLRREVDYRLGS